MRTLGGALRKGPEAAGGAFLPQIFRRMEEMGIRARLGTVTVIAGPPGALKTGFTLYYLLRVNLPTLYLSADAEDFEIDERAAAAISGDTMETVRRNPAAYAELLEAEASNIRLVFESAPRYDDLVQELMAYAETFGEYPKCVVLDNLMNLVGENQDEWASMRDSTKVLHEITRATGAAVFVLHHMADDRTDTSVPAPRKSLQGKISQLPKAIWSLSVDGDTFRVAPVKNKVGPEYPSGKVFAEMYVTPNNSRFYNSRNDLQMGRPA